MKLPALCIAACFAAGIALGLFTPLGNLAPSVRANRMTFLFVLALVALCFVLMRKDSLVAAAIASLATWFALGVFASWCALQPTPQNHVLNLVNSGRVGLSSPLRWHAHLRDEPVELPWGTRFDLALDSVEYEGGVLPTVGGLRLSYSPQDDLAQLLQLHSGDGVSFVAHARLPQLFRDEGAFDRREYLQEQGIALTATLRSASLIQKESSAAFSIANLISKTRKNFREELNDLFRNSPPVAGVLRAMLLGDRSFVDREESVTFQQTGVFHILVVAGLHVGSFAVFLYWLGRKVRLSIGWTTFLLLFALASYVAVIEQRTPVLRASLMAVVLLAGGYFFRRLELLNSGAIAALLLLIVRPLELRDSSFQLSFLSIGCIAGIALPIIERTIELYVRGLRGWRDVTRDVSHPPRVTQFRIDLRSLVSWLAVRLPARTGELAGNGIALSLRILFRAWELVFLTLVLQVGMLPLMANDFHRVTIFGALANLLAVPLTGLLVPAGFLLLLVGAASHAAALWLSAPVRIFTQFLIQAVAWFAHLPHGSYRIPGPPSWLLVSFFLLAISVSVFIRAKKISSRLFLAVSTLSLLAATALIAIYPFSPRLAKGSLELNVLDVGQGDSLFLVSPGGHTLLIDGGGQPANYGGHESQQAADPGEEAVSPYLWSRGLKKIDVVALTHAHEDHLGGLFAVLENFQVGELWLGHEVKSAALNRLEALASAHNIPIRHESRGDTFDWNGTSGTVLWPEPDSLEPLATAKNNDSLVLHIRYRRRSFFLSGDAEFQAESKILSENPDALRADVLKVGHHGSKNSTTPELLAAVRPHWALISAGAENPYGHPSPELLQRLEAAGVKTLRTDVNGAIHLVTDGDRITISCFVDCSGIVNSDESTAAQPPNRQ